MSQIAFERSPGYSFIRSPAFARNLGIVSGFRNYVSHLWKFYGWPDLSRLTRGYNYPYAGVVEYHPYHLWRTYTQVARSFDNRFDPPQLVSTQTYTGTINDDGSVEFNTPNGYFEDVNSIPRVSPPVATRDAEYHQIAYFEGAPIDVEIDETLSGANNFSDSFFATILSKLATTPFDAPSVPPDPVDPAHPGIATGHLVEVFLRDATRISVAHAPATSPPNNRSDWPAFATLSSRLNQAFPGTGGFHRLAHELELRAVKCQTKTIGPPCLTRALLGSEIGAQPWTTLTQHQCAPTPTIPATIIPTQEDIPEAVSIDAAIGDPAIPSTHPRKPYWLRMVHDSASNVAFTRAFIPPCCGFPA